LPSRLEIGIVYFEELRTSVQTPGSVKRTVPVNTAFTLNYMNFIDSFRFLKVLPLMILIFAGLGCVTMMETVESTKIPQSEIAQTYAVTATREKTQVNATFNHGTWGKSVDLDAPSRIEYNGRELPQNTITFLNGTSYTTTLEGAQTVHNFVYTNNDGRMFRNELSFEAVELPPEDAVINPFEETKIRLSRAVKNGENVSISLTSREAPPAPVDSNGAPRAEKPGLSKEYEISLNDELDATRTTIILKPKNLKNFVPGKAVLSVEVSRELSLREATNAGGTMRWSYRSTRPASVGN
jgi:hypothetical protein